uniref:Uncharacterized protein n=1 Tax=Anguilla anguilla TaxID=7936 RepID=A0A0E9RZZ4_ANGAN
MAGLKWSHYKIRIGIKFTYGLALDIQMLSCQ